MPEDQELSEEERENLLAYLDGEADEETARGIEARLSLEPRVRAEAEALQRTWELLDYLPRPDASPSFTHRTLDRVSVLRPATGPARWRSLRNPAWRRLAAAAAILITALAGYGVTAALTRSQPVLPAENAAELEHQLVRDLRLLENRRLYEAVDNIEFLHALDAPHLFGDDSTN